MATKKTSGLRHLRDTLNKKDVAPRPQQHRARNVPRPDDYRTREKSVESLPRSSGQEVVAVYRPRRSDGTGGRVQAIEPVFFRQKRLGERPADEATLAGAPNFEPS